MSTPTSAAYQYCQQLARQHYENFPVASRLLPRRLRAPIAAVYAFARTADDIADEGEATAAERLQRLDDLEVQLLRGMTGGHVDDPILIAAIDTIQSFQLPLSLFQDLLNAFRQDVSKTRYANFGEVMQYCRLSANPVGRLLLYLNNAATERNLAYSDAICSALQLINFLQDLHQDLSERNRIYLPMDEMQRFQVTEDHLRNRISDAAMRRLLVFQSERARRLLHSGAPLGKALSGRFGLEIRTITLGGDRIIQHLLQQQTDLFTRPRLSRRDWIWMLWHAMRKK